MRSCFAPDVQAEYAGVVLDPGVDALIEHVSIVSTFVGSMHFVGNVVADVDGDEAHSTCRCVAYVLRETRDGVRLFMRGLTYEDRWVAARRRLPHHPSAPRPGVVRRGAGGALHGLARGFRKNLAFI